jgi:hypothetical protein
MRPLTAADVRQGVEAMLAERLEFQHRPGSVYATRQEGEANMLRAVLRLIDTGHWREPRPGEVGREAGREVQQGGWICPVCGDHLSDLLWRCPKEHNPESAS